MGNGENRKSQPTAPVPSAPRPRLFNRVMSELSVDALFEAAEQASQRGLTLGEFIDRRCDEIVAQLVRDAAPSALRELRRITPPRGVAI